MFENDLRTSTVMVVDHFNAFLKHISSHLWNHNGFIYTGSRHFLIGCNLLIRRLVIVVCVYLRHRAPCTSMAFIFVISHEDVSVAVMWKWVRTVIPYEREDSGAAKHVTSSSTKRG